jgi:hypothetical protein
LNLTHTAKALDISRQSLVNYLKRDEELREEFKDVDACEVDDVRVQLVKLCNEGYFPAIRFFLENRGFMLGFCDSPIDSYVDDSDNSVPKTPTRVLASMTTQEKSDAYAKMLEEDAEIIDRQDAAARKRK